MRSAVATLLLSPTAERPVYLSAPVLLHAPVFDNAFGQYSGLFPALADHPQIRLGDVILALAASTEVRLITRQGAASDAFLATHLQDAAGVEARLSDASYPEVGLLAPTLFVSGALRVLPLGVCVGEDVVTYLSASSPAGAEAIARAYLEFDRRWTRLGGHG
jgi:hypothetical protein